ncbi:hypothetical protein ABK040_003469 [Willaertia magna]
MDGRTIENLRTVIVTLIILNLNTFGTQERECVFLILLYIGEEFDIIKYINNLQNEVKQLMENGIEIIIKENEATLFIKENTKFKINIFWISNLCSLQYVSNLRINGCFCIKCNCKKGNSLIGGTEFREITHILLIPFKNILICILHLDECIFEYLLKMCLLNKEIENDILNKLYKLPTFFKFIFQQKSNDKDNIKQNILQNTDYQFMLIGLNLKVLFSNSKYIFNKLPLKQQQLIEKYKEIREWLYYDNNILKTKELNDLEKLINEFKLLIHDLRSDTGNIGDYIYILIQHIIPIIKEISNLLLFSNQTVKALH